MMMIHKQAAHVPLSMERKIAGPDKDEEEKTNICHQISIKLITIIKHGVGKGPRGMILITIAIQFYVPLAEFNFGREVIKLEAHKSFFCEQAKLISPIIYQ